MTTKGLDSMAGAVRRCLSAVALVALALGGTAAQAQAQTQPLLTPSPLKYFKNYFVTGDYLATGVSLKNSGGVGTLRVNGEQIPRGADIVAAYLYWETASPTVAPALTSASFNNSAPGALADAAVLLNGAAPSGACAASGAGSVYVYRADVLPFFARIRPTATGTSGQILQVNQPVQTQVAGPHPVSLPAGTLGAGLIIVYRVVGYDPTEQRRDPLQPLRSIVIFDGGYTGGAGLGLVQTLEGFYEASRQNPQARMSMLVGGGNLLANERVWIRNTNPTSPLNTALDTRLVALSPFNGAGGPGDRPNTGFDAVTFNWVPLEPGAMKAFVTVDNGFGGAANCLNWGAMVLSTNVQDRDSDGLLDVWENQQEFANKPPRLTKNVYSSWPLTDPTGAALPNLQAMGANPNVQDVFVQVDYMQGADHSHLPSKAVLDQVWGAFQNAAPRPSLIDAGLCSPNAAPGACPINIHFDVGGNYQTSPADPAIVPAAYALGGNAIQEQVCSKLQTPPPEGCAFPSSTVPGIVGWKTGFRAYRDGLIVRSGASTASPRFPRIDKDIVHYALFAHALGAPSSDGINPTKNSGVADSGGGDLMITFGLWANYGSDFVQASTLMHELGHNLGLRHGGVSPNGAILPNCRPNYQSVMSYLFQISGLLPSLTAAPVIDFSRQRLPTLDETVGLNEQLGMGPTTYVPRWYVAPSPSGSSGNARRCNGSLDTGGSPLVTVYANPMQAKLTPTTPYALDWNGSGVIDGTLDTGLDVNYDAAQTGVDSSGNPVYTNVTEKLGPGANDYSTMDLRQIGARRNVGSPTLSGKAAAGSSPYPVGGALSLDSGYGDLGVRALGYGDLGYGDLGYGDLGYGDLGYGDLGYGDLGYGDLGAPFTGTTVAAVSPGTFSPPPGTTPSTTGAVAGEVDLATASSAAPIQLTASQLPCPFPGSNVYDDECDGPYYVQLNWQAPNVAPNYTVYRIQGVITPSTVLDPAQVVARATVSGTSYVDAAACLYTEGPSPYTYFVMATIPSDGGPVPDPLHPGVSNFATINGGVVCDGDEH